MGFLWFRNRYEAPLDPDAPAEVERPRAPTGAMERLTARIARAIEAADAHPGDGLRGGRPLYVRRGGGVDQAEPPAAAAPPKKPAKPSPAKPQPKPAPPPTSPRRAPAMPPAKAGPVTEKARNPVEPQIDLWPSGPGGTQPQAPAAAQPAPLPLVLMVPPPPPPPARMSAEQERAEIARLEAELAHERQLAATAEFRERCAQFDAAMERDRAEAVAGLIRGGYIPRDHPKAQQARQQQPLQRPGETTEQYEARLADTASVRAYAERRNREERRNQR